MEIYSLFKFWFSRRYQFIFKYESIKIKEVGRLTTAATRRSQHSQECKDPRWQCFCDSRPWPLTFWLQINGFSEFVVEHFMSSLMILGASVFEISCGKTDRQTDRRTEVTTLDNHRVSSQNKSQSNIIRQRPKKVLIYSALVESLHCFICVARDVVSGRLQRRRCLTSSSTRSTVFVHRTRTQTDRC